MGGINEADSRTVGSSTTVLLAGCAERGRGVPRHDETATLAYNFVALRRCFSWIYRHV